MDPEEDGEEGTDWTHLAQDRDKWHALVDIVMDRQVPHNVTNLTG